MSIEHLFQKHHNIGSEPAAELYINENEAKRDQNERRHCGTLKVDAGIVFQSRDDTIAGFPDSPHSMGLQKSLVLLASGLDFLLGGMLVFSMGLQIEGPNFFQYPPRNRRFEQMPILLTIAIPIKAISPATGR